MKKMKIFYKGGRGMPCGQSDKVTQLHSNKPTLPHIKHIGIILFFCLFNDAAFGQSRTPSEAATEVVQIKPLEIGDTIPEELWQMPLQVVNHPDGNDTITLSDYRDKKLIILDFWATWCAPCVKSLHKLDTLQEEYLHDLLVLPISYEDGKVVNSFFGRMGWNMPSAIDGVYMPSYFPHKAVPHQVWIKDSKVQAITSASSATRKNIEQVVAGVTPELKVKRERDVDPLQPITHVLTDDDKVLVQSYILGYVDGIGNTVQVENDSLKVLSLFNRPILSMMKDIMKAPYAHFILNVADTARLFYRAGDFSNIYTYQLLARKPYSQNNLEQRCIADLTSYFGLHLEKKSVESDVFVIKDLEGHAEDAIRSYAGKAKIQIEGLRQSLEYSTQWHSDLPRYVNDSKSTVSLPKDILEHENINDLNKRLATYGLTVVRERRFVDYYLISDV